MERTLILVKPDGVHRGLIGQIINRFEARGLKLVGMKFVQMSEELAANHYAVHKGKPFYEKLVTYIVSGPVVAMGNPVTKRALAAIGPDTRVVACSLVDFGSGEVIDRGYAVFFNAPHSYTGEDTVELQVDVPAGASALTVPASVRVSIAPVPRSSR